MFLSTIRGGAACSPDITANATPNYTLLVLGLRQPVEHTLGVVTQLHAERVVTALRADADVLKMAATPEQRARMEGRDRDKRAVAPPCGPTRTRAAKKADEAVDRAAWVWGEAPQAPRALSSRRRVRRRVLRAVRSADR